MKDISFSSLVFFKGRRDIYNGSVWRGEGREEEEFRAEETVSLKKRYRKPGWVAGTARSPTCQEHGGCCGKWQEPGCEGLTMQHEHTSSWTERTLMSTQTQQWHSPVCLLSWHFRCNAENWVSGAMQGIHYRSQSLEVKEGIFALKNYLFKLDPSHYLSHSMWEMVHLIRLKIENSMMMKWKKS